MCLCWVFAVLVSTLWTLRTLNNAAQVQICNVRNVQERAITQMNQNTILSQSLWPLLFVNQDSILCLGPKRQPDSVDFILLMILIFNARFGGLPLLAVQEDFVKRIFSFNLFRPNVKLLGCHDVRACGTLTGRLENYSKVFTNCALSQTQSRHSSNISF